MQAQPTIKNRTTYKGCVFAITVLLVLCCGVLAQQNEAGETEVRIGYNSSIFVGVNMTDARNSVKALTANLARGYDIAVNAEPLIYNNVSEAEEILHSQLVGMLNMPIGDFWLLRSHFGFDRFLLTVKENGYEETYIVLTKANSDVATLADLKGKHLMLMTHPSMSLATVWLDVELAKNELPPTTQILGTITEATKPARAVLPVFFGQADACLTTLNAYNTMVELNPQVGLKLRIIATSPKYIPMIFATCTDLATVPKEKTIQAICGLSDTAVGRQTLTLFQTEAIIEYPASTLAPTLALLDEHARLCPEANAILVANLRGRPSSLTPEPR